MTFETLHNDMIKAMKARDKARKDVLSTLIADVKKAAIDAGKREDIPEELVDQTILKSKKTAREQLDTCPDERTELKAEYQFAYDVICEYAPKMMSDDEIRAFLTANYADLLATKNKGQIMKAIMPALKGKADGKAINAIVAEMSK
ncbi:MAG TPA: GatB/YqeY domain-containing protein [Candidatus Pullichristensenella excrementigallinarum]|uniref:GatB/YqeY domain-containing protein n=1 Tax=Candidatus Pullichristensenella excrementigallinarum TaxID=2840907 RepID=A0A9D1LBM8_9FIRM|nr:GatB/YqeY domain-containing protein [Candidatus Pullichristensenella excrementigallinarum]